jgi:O-antigen ligase
MDIPRSKFDTVIERLLIALLAFMPLAFGAVEAWSEAVVVTLAAAISISFFLKLIYERDVRPVWSWAYLPVALFILVVAFQLIPLKATLVDSLSPGTAAIKKELLGDLPYSASVLQSMTLSFYPGATRHDLRLVLAVTAVFVVVLNVYRRESQIRRLLWAIAAIGGAMAVLALAQDLFGNGRIYWLVPTASSQAYCGTFVCHSHYGQFMNLSVGAAFGLILVKIHEDLKNRRLKAISQYIGSPKARTVWILIGIIIVGVTTLFVSLTRGGMISMLVAASFTTLVMCSRRSLKGSGWIVLLAALGAFVCVLYLGFDAVYDRLSTLREGDAYKARRQIVKDIAVAWTRFPVFGTGLGTHEVVYPMFDRSSVPALATHAENEYAQAAEETGLAGLVTLVGFGLVVGFNYARSIRRADVPIRLASYGLGLGLVAVLIHSLSDFGQHLPANAMLSAVFCALLIALGRMGRRSNSVGRFIRVYRGSYVLRVIALIGAAGVWTWLLLGAHHARVGEGHWKRALAADQNIAGKGEQATDDDYIALISSAAAAAEYEPDNVKYRHWLNFYRWESISRVTDPNTGAVIIPEEAKEFVYGIVDEFHRARLLCPTYGATYCVLGQLERFVLDDPNGAELIRKGFQLAPCDPTACFVAGLLDVEEGDIEASLVKLDRAVRLDGGLFAKVARVYVDHAGRPDLALMIAGQDMGRLSQVAGILTAGDEHQFLAIETRAKVIELLEARCRRPDAPAGALASLAKICQDQDDKEKAIELYRRALAREYGQVQWRLVLATLLAQTDRVHEAIQEAKTCLRLNPGSKAARRLIEDLSVLPEALVGGGY